MKLRPNLSKEEEEEATGERLRAAAARALRKLASCALPPSLDLLPCVRPARCLLFASHTYRATLTLI